MFCDEVLDAVEAVAAGELTPDGRIAIHLATCPHCAAALAGAQELERMLRTRPVPQTSSHFTSHAMARVRRARWRSDQYLDIGFNIALGTIVLSVVAAIWMFVNRSGLTAVSDDAVALLGTAVVTLAQRVAPSIPLYAGATAILVTALGVWWWAERDATS